MKTIEVRNVNEALHRGVRLLQAGGVVREGRTGRVLEYREPVATTYTKPQERVLWSWGRRANPFFHFFEAMWMLNGGKDVAFAASLLERMREYSDDGVLMQGAYGYRWREYFAYDQLIFVENELRQSPASRRAVLSMWSANDLVDTDSKDIPCNTHIYFKVRDGALHMTVCNRSNDIIWGAYGANAVHMSFLQEYLAGRLGLRMGLYHQISDSFHAYLDGPGGEVWTRVKNADDLGDDFYATVMPNEPLPTPVAMISEYGRFEWDDDMRLFFATVGGEVLPNATEYKTYWWREVAVPYWRAWKLRDALILSDCGAPDWRWAGRRWFLQQRKELA